MIYHYLKCLQWWLSSKIYIAIIVNINNVDNIGHKIMPSKIVYVYQLSKCERQDQSKDCSFPIDVFTLIKISVNILLLEGSCMYFSDIFRSERGQETCNGQNEVTAIGCEPASISLYGDSNINWLRIIDPNHLAFYYASFLVLRVPRTLENYSEFG